MFELLVGVNVTSEDGYQTYRDNIAPILTEHGGGFGYDFRVSEVLKSQSENLINRVFTIYFPDEKTKDAFFANADYLEVKKAHFEGSISHTTIIAEYTRN